MAHNKSLRQSVNAMCKMCIYDGSGGGGTWKNQVKDCTSGKCPLFCQRPLPVGVEHKWEGDKYCGIGEKVKKKGLPLASAAEKR